MNQNYISFSLFFFLSIFCHYFSFRSVLFMFHHQWMVCRFHFGFSMAHFSLSISNKIISLFFCIFIHFLLLLLLYSVQSISYRCQCAKIKMNGKSWQKIYFYAYWGMVCITVYFFACCLRLFLPSLASLPLSLPYFIFWYRFFFSYFIWFCRQSIHSWKCSSKRWMSSFMVYYNILVKRKKKKTRKKISLQQILVDWNQARKLHYMYNTKTIIFIFVVLLWSRNHRSVSISLRLVHFSFFPRCTTSNMVYLFLTIFFVLTSFFFIKYDSILSFHLKTFILFSFSCNLFEKKKSNCQPSSVKRHTTEFCIFFSFIQFTSQWWFYFYFR